MHSIEEALVALKNGEIVIVVDDENRENEGDFIVLGEYATPATINFMAMFGRGLICVPISNKIADKLNLHPMVARNTDHHETAFTISIDYKTTTTGISAFERSETILALLDENNHAADFKRPGHVFPLIAKDGGVVERRGHTEAGVELAKLCDSKEVAVICEILNDDGTMARLPELEVLAEKWKMPLVSIEQLTKYVSLTHV
ncbi:MAG: 3,4-dihydroxy-2-butanone-4-phosphate synthase [Solibacillus sp.]